MQELRASSIGYIKGTDTLKCFCSLEMSACTTVQPMGLQQEATLWTLKAEQHHIQQHFVFCSFPPLKSIQPAAPEANQMDTV